MAYILLLKNKKRGNNKTYVSNWKTMKLNSLKVFLRNIQKQKVVTFMNIAGLSLGMSIAILAGLWTINELNYDKFHRNSDRMYRLLKHFYWDNKESVGGSVFRPFGEIGKAEIPEIEKMCRVVPLNDEKVSIGNVLYTKNNVLVADENFFDFFTFSLKEGDASSVLAFEDNMVIDESTARRYFPEGNALGKVIRYADKDWKVSGIMADMPSNSHLRAHIIIPPYGPWKQYSWGGADQYVTYFILRPGADIKKLNEQFTQIGWNGMPFLREAKAHHTLQPLKDIHFEVGFNGEKGNKSFILAFGITALIVLLISCINFASLFISTAFLRAKSVGIKKTHGAGKRNLILGFYSETFYYVCGAVIIAFGTVHLLLPVFNHLIGTNLQIDLGSPVLYLFLGLLLVFMVLFAGTFPAFYMTRFNTVQTLAGKFKGNNLSFLQKGLLVAQFTIALAFLLSVFFIHKQVNYMVSGDLGFEKENVFYIEARDGMGRNYEAIREELLQNASIQDVTVKNSLPQEWRIGWPVKKTGSLNEYDFMTEICRVRENYFSLMKMELIEGENPFSPDFGGMDNYCVINETAARMLDLEQPLEGRFEMFGKEYVVKGVVKDAHTKALYKPVDPQVYLSLDPQAENVILIKAQGDLQDAIGAVKKVWAAQVTSVPFDYGFLDSDYKALYQKEINFSQMLKWMMLLTLLISISGLFNMSYYATGRRIKEVGIRKINGASLIDLLTLLNRDFLLWVLIAFIAACPLAYVFIRNWQESFVLKTALSGWIFALTGFLAVLISLLTVSYQTWRAANVNPVEVLKNE